jgi:uroporphyrinogen-III synthase
MTRALTGIGVLITRPVEQAQGLVRAVESAGGRACLYPAIQLVRLEPAATQLRALREADDLLFVSPAAARIAVPWLDLPQANPIRRFFAVGEGTARELTKLGAREVIQAQQGADSEALLLLPDVQQVTGRKMVIVRGEGGRELLRQTLQERGAEVTVFECYRRELPTARFPGAFEREVQAVTATSSEIVSNLFTLAGPANVAWLRHVPMFVSHPRIGRKAFQCGARTVCVVPARVAVAADQALADALCHWFEH